MNIKSTMDFFRLWSVSKADSLTVVESAVVISSIVDTCSVVVSDMVVIVRSVISFVLAVDISEVGSIVIDAISTVDKTTSLLAVGSSVSAEVACEVC